MPTTSQRCPRQDPQARSPGEDLLGKISQAKPFRQDLPGKISQARSPKQDLPCDFRYIYIYIYCIQHVGIHVCTICIDLYRNYLFGIFVPGNRHKWCAIHLLVGHATNHLRNSSGSHFKDNRQPFTKNNICL